MGRSSTEVYLAAFLARCAARRHPGRTAVDQPGAHGLLASGDDPLARLLVTDDRAYDWLARLLPDCPTGMINVFAAAGRCVELIESHPEWKSTGVSAMICRDLQAVPAVPLPSELTLRAVRRVDGAAQDGVALQDAVAAAMLADPRISDPPEIFADFLRSLPVAFRLFAAVDAGGTVRGTSGSGAFGAEASVIFVNTDPGWRGRGIGRAMSAAALRAALDRGARRACLDASDIALSIYLRLGFELVTRATHFSRGG